MVQTHEIFISDCKKQIRDNKQEDNYCIILYKTREYSKNVHKIYKNLDDYEKCGLDDINNLEPRFGVTLQLWFFD